MNNGGYIEIYPIYFPFCPGYYTLSTFLSGLFHNGHNCAPELRRDQTPQLLPRAGKPRTATSDSWPGKLSYFNSFWSPRSLGKITRHYFRPIFTIGRRWDIQGLPLWDFTEQGN